MNSFPVDTDAILQVPFAREDGTAVTPTAASYVVLDGSGNTLVSRTTVNDVSGTSTAITVPAASNAEEGARSLVLTMTTAQGTVIAETVFAIVGQTALTFLVNTIQTYAQALFTAQSIPGLDAFKAAAKQDQTIALIEGFRRLTLMNYVIPWPEVVDVMNYLYPRYAWEITPRMWPMMSADLYSRYPEGYHLAMRRAQVVEANFILTGDVIGDKMRSGLLAWTVGESKMMFRSGVKPLHGTLARETMNHLQGWVDNRRTITRS